MDQSSNPYSPPASSEPAPDAPRPPGFTPDGDRICPFCGAAAPATFRSPPGDLTLRCPSCGRDTTLPRVVCSHCKRMTPTAEPACCYCGERRTSELRWKVPLIIALFVLALVISIAVRLF